MRARGHRPKVSRAATRAPRFLRYTQLVGNATTLSYTATHGSYYRPWDAHRTVPVPGWARADPSLEANPPFGMHALTFVSHAERRVLIAYRGTDTNASGASGQADLCADALLWRGYVNDTVPPAKELPAYCGNYSVTTLDYLTAARTLAGKVAAAFPGYSLLYTGHSLGAGLSMLMAAASGNASCGPTDAAGALVFSSPEVYWAITHRLSVTIPALDVSKFAVLADFADPIYRFASVSQFGGLLGTVCLWEDKPAPLPCQLCHPTHPDEKFGPFCLVCFAERHIYSHYVGLIRNGTLPVCRPQALRECTDEANCPTTGVC